MKSNFVSYEQALALKELGFDEKCIAKYTIVPEDDINWFSIAEQTISDGKQLFGGSKNYNTKLYNDEGTISAPLKSQVFKFFRDSFSWKQFVSWRPNVKKFAAHIVDMTLNGIEYAKSRGFKEFNSDLLFDDYDKAESHLIDLMIERAKQQRK